VAVVVIIIIIIVVVVVVNFPYLPILSNPLSGSDLFIKLAFFFKSEQDGDFHSLSNPRA
uniref:Uncharacterized protein n=1 Tax=Amphimedon queenslandica TaxID=400682 RepID=A0A1X7VLP3_AMPQE